MATDSAAQEESASQPKTRRNVMHRIRDRIRRDPSRMMVLEQRVLLLATVGTILGIILWVIAVSTDHWFTVSIVKDDPANKTKLQFLSSHSGLWKICKNVIANASASTAKTARETCQHHSLFPSQKEIQEDPEIDKTIMDYTRSEIAFAIISFILMLMSVGFSIYTFKEPRYMFKRLAGGVQFLSAAVVLVVIEVVINSIHYEEKYLNARHPKGASWTYGYSFYLSWITFVLYIMAACIFIICSRKRKREKAHSVRQAEENEPNILGRM